nr:holin [Burkholderia pseudomallei]
MKPCKHRGCGALVADIGVIVGIMTAIATFGLNFFFMWRKDRREQRESDMRILEMERHDG